MNGTMLGKAVEIAAHAHVHQKDKGGNAYILHPIRLMMRLRTDDEELMCIAVLHDVIEDHAHLEHGYRFKDLEDAGMSERVLEALELLTHDKNEDYMSYIKRISTNIDATRVKLEDLRDNSDITRLKGLREKDFERIEKYHRAFLYLKKARENHKILEAGQYEVD